ncbi:MAG: TlpA family protein disulfide reductase [Deltaproteobacteria bacterium]|nr:MAG: TlpA family protein disulfide reductase [Deltaproteobacteria bacterium]
MSKRRNEPETAPHSEPEGAPATASSVGPLTRIGQLWRGARRRWWSRWAIDIAILMAIFWAVGRYQSRNLLDDRVMAPDFTLVDLDGVKHTLSDYRGQKVLLLFWAPWCTVCHLESDNWARLQSWREDVRVIAVAGGWETKASVEEFIGDDRGAYPVLLGNDAVLRAYHVDSFPTHYIIDTDGSVAWQGAGYSPTIAVWMRL